MKTPTQYDPSDAAAQAPIKMVIPQKTDTTYNNPGMPKPPYWGTVPGFIDRVDNDDEGPESRDEY